MSLYAKASGVWKSITEALVRANGVWKRAEVFVNNNGTWVSIHKNGNIPAGLIVFTESQPVTGWATKSALLGKYLMHGDTYGTTGGSSTHSHGAASVGQLANNTTATVRYHKPHHDSITTTDYTYSGGHSHGVDSHSHGATGHTPPYISLRPIESTDQTFLPANSILLIDTTNIPNGFERYGQYDKYIVCSDSPGSQGGNSTHEHSISQNSYSTCSNFTAMHWNSAGNHAKEQYNHSHTVSHSHVGNNDPQAKNYLAVKSITEMYDVPSGVIGIFTGTIPSGWTQISGTGLLVRIGVDGTVGANYGGGSHSHSHSSFSSGSSPCIPGSFPTPETLNAPTEHCHAWDYTLTYYECGVCPCHDYAELQGQLCNSFNISYPGNHTHTVSGGSSHDSANHMPPYITVKLAKKQ